MMQRDPTNLLIIVSDQHNTEYLGRSGTAGVLTPNLDLLAAHGTRFANAYCNSPICVPSRASFTTGAYVHQIGYWDNAIAYDGRVEGWPHALTAAGSRAVSIGKLHFKDEASPTGFEEQILPMHIMDGIGMVWGSVRDPLPVRENGELIVSTAGPGESDYTRYDRAVTRRACAWLKAAAEQAEPWCLFVGLLAPHPPYVAPQEYFDLYKELDVPAPALHPDAGWTPHPWVRRFMDVAPGIDNNTPQERIRAARAYRGLCSFLDDNIGQILAALGEAGLSDCTRIIYTSDHGDMVGERGQWNKSMPYEASAAVPMIAAGPGVPAGKIVQTPVSLVDVHASVLDTFAVPPLNDGVARPGRSLFDMAAARDDPDRIAFSEYHAYGAVSAWYMIRKRNWKLVWYVGFEPELFDLASDPNESINRARDPSASAARIELELALRSILDPDAVDACAKADQRALVDRFGGPEAALNVGTTGATPPPKDES